MILLNHSVCIEHRVWVFEVVRHTLHVTMGRIIAFLIQKVSFLVCQNEDEDEKEENSKEANSVRSKLKKKKKPDEPVARKSRIEEEEEEEERKKAERR